MGREVSKAPTTMKSYLALVLCSMLALQAVSMVDEDGCIPERCGKYIIISGQGVPNTDGECQKNKPADAWYAMQNPGLCTRSIVDDSICWCVVPKCKPVECGTQAFNERVGTKESKCYSEKQDNMICRQRGDLCKEIKDPYNERESRPCYCCWKPEIVIPPVSGCKDNRCGRFWQARQGKGECVNVTSVAFSKIEAEYDLRYSGSWLNKKCAPADPKSDKDCCLCLRKRPCVDRGCIEKGGMCVDMKNAQLGPSSADYGVRSEVDLDSPLGDDLCANDREMTTAGPPKQCCTCYRKKGNDDDLDDLDLDDLLTTT